MVRIAFSSRSAARFGLAVVFLAAFGPAHAADLPPPAPLPNFGGASVSLDGGHVWSGQQAIRTSGLTAQEQLLIDVGNVGRVKMPTSSFVLRGGVGYDYQAVPGMGFVVGVAADALYTNLQRNRTAQFSFGDNDVALHAQQRLDFLGTVRGRLGYALGPVLVYGTGGLAYGGLDLKARTDLSTAGYSGIYDAGRSGGIETGYVYGGGLEWMANSLMPSLAPGTLALKIEYLRYDLGRRTVAVSGQGPVFGTGGPRSVGHTANSSFGTDGQFVSAGLTYRFGGLGH